MGGLILIELALVFTSGLLALTLWLAWRLFDRPRHALTWAVAFGCATLQWAISGFGAAMFGSWPGFGFVAGAFVAAMTTLIAVGARQRAGLADRPWRFAGMWAAGVAALAVATFGLGGTAPRLVVTNLYAALILPLAVVATARRGRMLSLPELCLIAALGLFAAFALTLALVALGLDGPDGASAAATYRTMIGVGLSPVCIALGLALCFVLTGDLAARLHALVTCDPLTGALNRRGLEQAAANAIAAARRNRRELTLVIADIDRFKAINDARGHAAGDRALCRFADATYALIRGDDLFARLGGDEFCLLLSGATPESAMVVLDRIRETVSEDVTASFGVASLRDAEDLHELLARADKALYRAKEDGRDRVMLAAV